MSRLGAGRASRDGDLWCIMCRTVPTTKNPWASNVSSAKIEKPTGKSKHLISSFKAGYGLASAYLSELPTAFRPRRPPRAALGVPAAPLTPPRAVSEYHSALVTDTSLKTLLLTAPSLSRKCLPPRNHRALAPRAPVKYHGLGLTAAKWQGQGLNPGSRAPSSCASPLPCSCCTFLSLWCLLLSPAWCKVPNTQWVLS